MSTAEIPLPREYAIQARLDSPSLSARYPPIASSVPVARRAVTEFAASTGVHGELLDAVKLAVSEAVTNVVRHAYPQTPGEVQVDAWRTAEDLWLLVADDGCGLQAQTTSAGLGQGLVLIQKMADDVWIVERSTGGTEVRMRFKVPREAPGQPKR